MCSKAFVLAGRCLYPDIVTNLLAFLVLALERFVYVVCPSSEFLRRRKRPLSASPRVSASYSRFS